MKKLSILLIAALFAFGFSACEKDEDKDESTNGNVTPTPTPTPSGSGALNIGSEDLAAIGVPIVDADDNVYMAFSDALQGENTTVVCIAPDNTKKWAATVDGYAKNLVMNDGKIYLGGKSKLYALNVNDGSEAWQLEITQPDASTASKVTHKPCIDPQGNIIVAMDAYLASDLATAVPGRIISVSPDGAQNWEHIITSGDNYEDRYIKLSAPIATSNSIYLVVDFSSEEYVYLYNFSGQRDNSYYTGNYINGRIHCANSSGDIFLTTQDDMDYSSDLISLAANLDENWTFEMPDYPASNAVIDADGNLYIGCEDGFTYKIDASGNEVWKADYGKIYSRGEMIIGADGNIYKCLQSPDYMDMATGAITEISFDGLAANDMALRSDGTIVFGDFGNVNFISTGSNGIDENAQWAKYGCDQKNTSLLD